MEPSRRPDSQRNSRRRASYPEEPRDGLDRVCDEFPEGSSSLSVGYCAPEVTQYRGHSSQPLPSHHFDNTGRTSRCESTPGSRTPRYQQCENSGASPAAKCKKVRSSGRVPRYKRRPRFRKIASSWTEIMTTISEDPTMEDEEEDEVSEDASSLSSLQSSLKTSLLSSSSFGVTDLVQAAGESSATPVSALNQLTSADSRDVESTPSGSGFGRTDFSSPFVRQGVGSTLDPDCPVEINHGEDRMPQKNVKETKTIGRRPDVFGTPGSSIGSVPQTPDVYPGQLAFGGTIAEVSGTRAMHGNDSRRKGASSAPPGEEATLLGLTRLEIDTNDTCGELPQAPLLSQKLIGCERVVESDDHFKLRSAAVLLALISIMTSVFLVRASYHVFLRSDRVAEKALYAKPEINATGLGDQPWHSITTGSPTFIGVAITGSRGPYTPHAKPPALYEDNTSQTSQVVTEYITESVTDNVAENYTRNVITSSSQISALSFNESAVNVSAYVTDRVTESATKTVTGNVIASSSSQSFNQSWVYSGNHTLVYQINLTGIDSVTTGDSSRFSALAFNESSVHGHNDTLVYQVNLTGSPINPQ